MSVAQKSDAATPTPHGKWKEHQVKPACFRVLLFAPHPIYMPLHDCHLPGTLSSSQPLTVDAQHQPSPSFELAQFERLLPLGATHPLAPAFAFVLDLARRHARPRRHRVLQVAQDHLRLPKLGCS